jgi:hypothetical protein|tara:strand:- start:282 stop:515 length:234 start_codon:yes stop_codon:yes gene_type:complete
MIGTIMNIKQIKKAIALDINVYWKSKAYQVIKDRLGQYLIWCNLNDHCIGLHGRQGTKYENVLNGQEQDFYIMKDYK